MQNFIDTQTNKPWAFEDDVIVDNSGGVYSFKTASGTELSSIPSTLQPYTPPAPTKSQQLLSARESAVNAVNSACQAQIIGGFTSSALGDARTYPSTDVDQRNLLSAAMASQGQDSPWATLLWCESGGVWSFASHTAAQVQQVNADFLAFRVGAQQKCMSLVAEIEAAADAETVEKIVW